MTRYLVEQTFPDGLKLSANDEGAEMCRVIVMTNAEDDVTWIHSYVSRDRQRTFCIYDAPSPEAIRRSAQRKRTAGLTASRRSTFSIPISCNKPTT